MLSEGIYYRVSKSQRGTGHTSRDQVFRFFYALRPIDNKQAELCLLDEDDKLSPTGVKEIVYWEECRDLQYLPKFDGHYARIKPLLEKIKPSGPPTPKARPAQPEPQPAANWWDAGGGKKNIF